MTIQTLQAHPEMWPAMDGPATDDQLWFHRHPGQVVRLRPQFPGEEETREALAIAAGSGPPLRLGATNDCAELPARWMAVVDLLRIAGLPHGTGGKSGRMKFACPEPLDAEMGQQTAALALRLVATVTPARPARRGARGFGRPGPYPLGKALPNR